MAWRIIAPPLEIKWPADGELTLGLLKSLVNLEATNLYDTATESDLSGYGLKEPSRKYVLKRVGAAPGGGPANLVVAEMDFGGKTNGLIYARRGDLQSETNYVYGVKAADLERLPATMLALREHRIWGFDSQGVMEIDVKSMAGLIQYQRLNENEFRLKLGTLGFIDNTQGFQIEGAAGVLGALKAPGRRPPSF